MKNIEFIEVYRTHSRSDLAFLESLLISHGINYFIENTSFANVYPLVVPFKIRVHADQIEKATEIINDFFSKEPSVNSSTIDESFESEPLSEVSPTNRPFPLRKRRTTHYHQLVAIFLILVFGFYFLQDIQTNLQDYEAFLRPPFDEFVYVINFLTDFMMLIFALGILFKNSIARKSIVIASFIFGTIELFLYCIPEVYFYKDLQSKPPESVIENIWWIFILWLPFFVYRNRPNKTDSKI